MNTGFIPAHELGRCAETVVSDICSPKKSTFEMEHPKDAPKSKGWCFGTMEFYDFPSIGNN